jgi:SLT domain-containing protein
VLIVLQYIPQTFRAYAVKGHNNIYSGYDQLLAFFNNKTWRRDLPYGRRGWGPRGGRKYEKGGIIDRVQMALMGEGNKEEVIIPLEQFKERAIKLLMYAAEKLGFDMTGMFNAQPQGLGASSFSGIQNVMGNLSNKVVSSIPGSSGQAIQINIQPADVYLDDEKVGEFAFEYVEDKQATNNSIRKTFGGK